MMSSDSQKAITQLHSQLPVHLMLSDVEQTPELIKLLQQLPRHVTKEGTSLHVHRDLEEAAGVLRQEKRRWLDKQVLYNELHELLLDQQIQNIQLSPSVRSQFYGAVGELVTLTEIHDYINCHPDPSKDLTLFGLQKDDIDRGNVHKKHLQSIQQRLIPEIEARLRQKCEVLVGFHESSTNLHTNMSESSNLMFAKASQLPSILETEQRHLKQETNLLQQDKTCRDKQLKTYLQTLMETLETLEKIVSKHRLKGKANSDTLNTEWLAARCDAMCVKVKCLELELLCDTYYADTVQALTTVRRELDRTVLNSEEELQQARHALHAYEAVGMGFDDIVQEYTSLRKDVENKRWALREMKKHDSSDIFK